MYPKLDKWKIKMMMMMRTILFTGKLNPGFKAFWLLCLHIFQVRITIICASKAFLIPEVKPK
jgi:hypothetical protein